MADVCFLLPNLRGDGAMRMMLLLAKGFASHGRAVDVLVTKREGELLSGFPEDLRLIDLKSSKPVYAVPAIVRYLRSSGTRILFATELYTGLPAMYAALLSRTGARCFIRQDNTWSEDRARARGRHRWITPLAARWLFPKATMIAVSAGVAEDLARSLPMRRSDIAVIYNPVLTDELEECARQATLHPWLLDGGAPVVLAVGRLANAKGFDLLIRSFAELVRQRPARLLILGEGPERTALESMVSDLGLSQCIQLPGFQSNPYSFMANADLFVLSSRWEGLPTVLIEALALGVPVVATNCPNGPSEILDKGRFGRLVSTGDSHALCCAMREALDSPNVKSPELDAWLERFSFDHSVAAHLALVDKIVENGRACDKAP